LIPRLRLSSGSFWLGVRGVGSSNLPVPTISIRRTYAQLTPCADSKASIQPMQVATGFPDDKTGVAKRLGATCTLPTFAER
jgi:hypothetical protein